MGALLKSLDERPSLPGLVQAREADDHRALQLLARNREIAELAFHPGAVRLLWEVCQIPDFRKVMSESHTRLLAHCFLHLAGPEGRLPVPWIASQMANLDRTDGDIDSLMTRIAHTRTWTYITHRSDWVEDAAAWQERARGIEDRLSDALHESITQRFVDRRSAMLVRQMASEGELMAAVSNAGEVLVEGAYVGRLEGLRFVPDSVDGIDARMLLAAASRVLRGEIAARARLLAADPDNSFTIEADGKVRWRGGAVARMVAGEQLLTPRVEPIAGDLIEGEAREAVRRRLQDFVRNEVERRLAPLFAASSLELGGAARGLVFQLTTALGCLPRLEVGRQVAALDPMDRAALSRIGVRFGTESVYFEQLLRVETQRFRALLWAVRHGRSPPPLPSARRLARPIEIDPVFPEFVLCDDRIPCDGRPGRSTGQIGTASRRGSPLGSRRSILGRPGAGVHCSGADTDDASTARGARLPSGVRCRRRDNLHREAAPTPGNKQRPGPRRAKRAEPSLRQAARAEARLRRNSVSPAPASRRLDQWLWFARFVKSRSLAGRLCAAGAVTVNGVAVRKANHAIRAGDVLVVPQGAFFRTVQVLALGERRGPASEARLMYEETAVPVRLAELAPAWMPLLMDDDEPPSGLRAIR